MSEIVPIYAVKFEVNGREINHTTLDYDFAMSYIHALLNDRVCDIATLLIQDPPYNESYRVMGKFKRGGGNDD